jgi:hypothetical protein
MKDELDRLKQLYQSGGVAEAGRGIFSWIATSSGSKWSRKKVTGALGGENVWERDWDVLCVLDGCRADLFEEVIGDSNTVPSVGSTSRTWVSRTFESCEHPNTVGYITGNPFWTEIDTDELGYFHVEGVIKTEQEIETVPPDVLAEHAIDIWRRRGEFSVDHLIIHFMQPHAPFRSEPDWFKRAIGEDSWSANVWKRLRDGEFTEQEVWEAYKDNLKWVLEDGIQPLRSNCDGTIALTADHGNAIGEWGFYGHPLGCPVSAVRKVPWKRVTGTDEETIQPEAKRPTEAVDIEEQLQALGYK